WKELDAPAVKVDAYRRGLQRSYLTLVNAKINAPPVAAPGVVPAGEKPGAGRTWRTRRRRSGRREGDVPVGAEDVERVDHGGIGQDDGSRDQGASGSFARRDREDPGSEVSAGGAGGGGSGWRSGRSFLQEPLN